MSDSSLFNGLEPSGAWEQTRALHYGDGVFRTVLVHGGECVDWSSHLRKLREDADALDLEVPDVALLCAEAVRLIGRRRGGVLKLILSRAGDARGYAPRTRASDRLLQWHPLPEYPAAFWDEGIAAGWSELRLAGQPRLAGIKHLNRLEQVLASRACSAEFPELLMCDAQDRVISALRGNLFLVNKWGRTPFISTPALEHAGVAGMMRGRVLELARTAGLDCRVETIARERVLAADEAFITNALVGIWPLRLIGTQSLPAPAPVTAKLMQLLAHPRWFES